MLVKSLLQATRDPKHEYEEGVPNASVLKQKISTLAAELDALPQDVNEGFPQASSVLPLKPQLVVIHRSAFEAEGRPEDEAKRALASFLEGLKDTDALFLIYSRKPQTDGTFVTGLVRDPEVKKRVFAYQFRNPHNPFRDDPVVENFVRTMQLMVQAKAEGHH